MCNTWLKIKSTNLWPPVPPDWTILPQNSFWFQDIRQHYRAIDTFLFACWSWNYTKSPNSSTVQWHQCLFWWTQVIVVRMTILTGCVSMLANSSWHAQSDNWYLCWQFNYLLHSKISLIGKLTLLFIRLTAVGCGCTVYRVVQGVLRPEFVSN